MSLVNAQDGDLGLMHILMQNRRSTHRTKIKFWVVNRLHGHNLRSGEEREKESRRPHDLNVISRTVDRRYLAVCKVPFRPTAAGSPAWQLSHPVPI